MPRLIWTPAALRDVQRLYRFLVARNVQATRRGVKAIRDRIGVLAAHAEVGRPAEEMEPEMREWPIAYGDSGYVVLYRHDGMDALVLAVRHQREAGYAH